MPTIVVDVMPKVELLDPQGKAVASALARSGFAEISAVRVGKRFELEITDPVDENTKARLRELAEQVLANSVIEDVTDIRIEPGELAAQPGNLEAEPNYPAAQD